MFSRAATLMCALLLVGCQNAPNQMSLYAPFGSSIVPPPSLTRANAAPYYNEPSNNNNAPASTPSSTTANAGNKDLSHYDPYRGILIPGGFTPAPVLARSTETWGGGTTELAAAPRERASQEEPIRIVESNNSPTSITAIASQNSSSRSNSVKFNASPPSGVVKPGDTLIAAPAKTKTVNAVEVARLPKTTTATPLATPTTAPITTPSSSPAFNTPTFTPLNNSPLAPPNNPAAKPPGLLPTPSSTSPVAPKPTGSNRLSLWDDPRDGSRVMPAAHMQESALPEDAGTWRAKR